MTDDKPVASALRFPIMTVESVGRFAPPSVPWEFIVQHEAQAFSNHQQSLSRLAHRGGLDVTEALAVVEGRRWKAMPPEEAGARFCAALQAWEERHGEIAKLRAEVEALRARAAEHEQLVDALRWLPVNCTLNFTDVAGLLEEVRVMGWLPGAGAVDDDDGETPAMKEGE